MRLPARLHSVAAVVFAAQFAALDVVARGRLALTPRHLLALVASALVFGLAATLARPRWARGAIALVAGVLLAVDAVYFHYYGDTLDAQALASARHAWPDVRRVLAEMLPRLVPLTAASVALQWGLLTFAARVGVPRTAKLGAVALAIAAIAGGPPLADATPELRLVDAALAQVRARPARHARESVTQVPALPSRRESLPSVVLVLTESVRASAYTEETAPEVTALFPDRVALRQMRAVASYTAVSFSAILTGRSQEGVRDAIAGAPTVFELLGAVRARDAHVTTAYWSAQSESVFEGENARAAIDRFATVETLVGHAIADEDEVVDRGVDRLLADYAVRELPNLPRPFFLVLHFAGTHAPYFVDDARAPFRPYRREVTWSGLPELYNAYKDAIYDQDRSIARALRAVLDATRAGPWAIVFTSDHGEAFGEHGAIHHGQNLFDEQIHVPAFVAQRGALRPDEVERLAAHGDAWLTHLDLLPTILDVYGVMGGFALAPYERALAGRSLLAPPARMPAPIPITNCTAMFPCPVSTWGLLYEDRALEAQRWDGDWRCLDLVRAAELDARDPSCDILRESSKVRFPELPNRKPNL
jgi:Sulfatase